MRGENQADRRQETIVLWHGQYQNDGRERLESLKRSTPGTFFLSDPRMEGQGGDWRIVAEAYVALDRFDNPEVIR